MSNYDMEQVRSIARALAARAQLDMNEHIRLDYWLLRTRHMARIFAGFSQEMQSR
jgi:hypothetical protein